MKYGLGLLAIAAVLALPLASACNGISPGDETDNPKQQILCTLAFIVAAPDALYFSTAGHCVKVGETMTTSDGKAIGVGAFHYLNPETGAETDGAPGEDFALIKIDPSLYDKLNPAVCGWGGPKNGIYREKPGGGDVHHYGWGTGISAASPKRSGMNLQNDNVAFYWTGEGLPGDSGSAVLAADGRALGVLTHLVDPVVMTVIDGQARTDTNGGTHMDRGFQLAKDKGGPAFASLRVVMDGEKPVDVMRQMAAQPVTPASATTPTGTPSMPASPSTSPSSPPASNGTSPSPTPTTPSTGANGDVETPGAFQEGPAKKTPGPELALVLGAIVAGLAARRRIL